MEKLTYIHNAQLVLESGILWDGALRMCKFEHGPDHFDVRLTGVKLGSVAMVGIPGEPFTEVGVKIKDTPGWDLILPCGLTNGYLGYFPVQAAFDKGGATKPAPRNSRQGLPSAS